MVSLHVIRASKPYIHVYVVQRIINAANQEKTTATTVTIGAAIPVREQTDLGYVVGQNRYKIIVQECKTTGVRGVAGALLTQLMRHCFRGLVALIMRAL